LVRGVNAPLPPEAKKILAKFDYEMVHSEVYLNTKYVVSIAPFSTPACPDIALKIYQKHRKLLFLHVFAF